VTRFDVKAEWGQLVLAPLSTIRNGKLEQQQAHATSNRGTMWEPDKGGDVYGTEDFDILEGGMPEWWQVRLIMRQGAFIDCGALILMIW
jgi:hypothetical protein